MKGSRSEKVIRTGCSALVADSPAATLEFLRARIAFLLTFALTALFLLHGASSDPPGIGYLDGVITAQDEAVYTHAAIQMAESGEWSTPVFMGRFFLYKPPLIYWLSGVSAKLFGVSAWSLRLPSILAASLTIALVVMWVGGAASWWRGVPAAMLLLASPLFVELGRRNMTDALTMLTIVATAWLLAQRKPVEFVAACVAAGILAKSIAGLIPLMISGVWWLAVKERPPLRRMMVAAGLGALIAAPWFVYQWETHRRWFEAEFIGIELLAYGASTPPQTSAESAPLFYATRLWENSAPLCVLFALAVPAWVAALRKRKSSGAVAVGCAIAIMAAAILGYQYRNATYLLPLLPLLAIAAAAYAPWWALLAAAPAAFLLSPTGKVSLDDGRSVVRLAETYCEMDRGNDLIVIGIDDNFSVSTLPLPKLRYAIRGAAHDPGQVTLDFRRMGIVLPAVEFDLTQARNQYSAELRAWGLPNDEALGTVIGWERPEELAALVRTHAAVDFLFPAGEAPASEMHTTTLAGPGRGTLLLSRTPRARPTPRRRACRL